MAAQNDLGQGLPDSGENANVEWIAWSSPNACKPGPDVRRSSQGVAERMVKEGGTTAGPRTCRRRPYTKSHARELAVALLALLPAGLPLVLPGLLLVRAFLVLHILPTPLVLFILLVPLALLVVRGRLVARQPARKTTATRTSMMLKCNISHVKEPGLSRAGRPDKMQATAS